MNEFATGINNNQDFQTLNFYKYKHLYRAMTKLSDTRSDDDQQPHNKLNVKRINS